MTMEKKPVKKLQTGRQVINKFFGLMKERMEDAYIVFLDNKKMEVDVKLHKKDTLEKMQAHYNNKYTEDLKRISNTDIQIVGFGAFSKDINLEQVLGPRKDLYKGKLFEGRE